ncbi:hypothetical protein EV561_103257 [Rhizobium sp. BK376]|nr:hypothetical protein EV561_103257 [Rhizobium sp. BK376]
MVEIVIQLHYTLFWLKETVDGVDRACSDKD